MNHVIVVAHPRRDSFTMALAAQYADELKQLRDTPEIRDLYSIGFDPVLPAEELLGLREGHGPAEEVRREQNYLKAADAVSVFYPLWWASMPAILKGYIDRVFSQGFAYDFGGGGRHALLTGKKSLIVTVSASPAEMLEKTGTLDAIRALQDRHIFAGCGFEVAEHLHFAEIVPHLTDAKAHGHFETVRAAARRHFGAATRYF